MTLKYIKSDLYRYTGHVSFKTFLKTYFFNRGFNFSFWLRLASSKTVWAKLAYPIYYYKKKPFTGIVFQNDKNGILSFEEEYVKGFQEGWYRSYYKNGKKKKEYKSHNNDIVKGTFKKWDEEGNLIDSF